MEIVVVEIKMWDADKAEALVRKIEADARVASAEVISEP